jgi:hypothetical protein
VRRAIARATKCKQAPFSWAKVNICSVEECWLWTATLNRWGYGQCRWNGRNVNASRAAFESMYGEVADGLVVCHRCDNPACCNPAHLFAATQAENLADCRAKGRQRYKTGETHHRATAKLTPERVLEARALFQSGVSQSEIGRQWGLHSSVISRAIRGQSWGHVK